MRVSIKGQVTIPKNIRDRFGIVPGSEVNIASAENGVLVSSARKNTRENKGIEFDQWAKTIKDTLSSNIGSGKAFTDWLRGPRDDVHSH